MIPSTVFTVHEFCPIDQENKKEDHRLLRCFIMFLNHSIQSNAVYIITREVFSTQMCLPFRLKNIGIDFQDVINRMFNPQFERNIEA